ncbi:MAG: hypothetical protein ED859_10380 [Desulfuromonadales bacterium]|nr:MAG: hypothetical protein ED859_10380 [Desulfuromonadales bacterium]
MSLQTLIALVCLVLGLAMAPPAFPAEPETVILLHGYGRTENSMRPLQDRLEAAGFRVHNVGYPSMRLSPPRADEAK